MIKKIISVLLTVSVLLCFASCGQKAKENTDKKQEKTQKKEEKEVVWTDDPAVESPDFIIDEIPAMRELNYYDSQIEKYEKDPIEQGKIIFYGSSGFTRWSMEYGNPSLASSVTSSTGEQVCINHGFGGSTMHELCHYYDRMVKPYNPKALVVTSFINDASFYSNEQIMQFVQWLFSRARQDFPGIKLYITDWRPTAKSRTYEEIERYQSMNKTLAAYAKVHTDVKVIELSKEPVFYMEEEAAKNGTYTDIDRNFFIEDQLHYTREGYKKIAEVFKRELADVLG